MVNPPFFQVVVYRANHLYRGVGVKERLGLAAVFREKAYRPRPIFIISDFTDFPQLVTAFYLAFNAKGKGHAVVLRPKILTRPAESRGSSENWHSEDEHTMRKNAPW